MKLWLLRHAPPICAPGLCYGATDLRADAQETERIATELAPSLPEHVAIWTSPLQRCTALADAVIRARPTLGPMHFDPRIAEMNFGAWECRPWSAIPRRDFDAWMADFADAPAGGGEGGGESTRDFMTRVGAAWDAWRAHGTDALWVTHAGVMRAVKLLREGKRFASKASEWPSAPIAFGAWEVVEV